MRLLFITPKIKEDDNDFAFAALWVKEFANQGFKVTVICLEKGKHSFDPKEVKIYSLGREKGWSLLRSFLWFQILVWKIKHERVFVHMNPRWLAAYWSRWFIGRKPTYLWYTHYTQPLSLKIGARFVKRMFTATEDCLPQYNNDPRKEVTGHGIDLVFWNTNPIPMDQREPTTNFLAVHRISRSKRIDIVLKALKLLPKEYTLTHYGSLQDLRKDKDTEYYEEIKRLVDSQELQGRVRFMGPIPMPELRKIYPRYWIMVNMVPDTIDKTVLEAMYCGVRPVITRSHAEAIGLLDFYGPDEDTPQALAKHLERVKDSLEQHFKYPQNDRSEREELREIVKEKHSLVKLVEKMGKYIRAGN